MDVVDWDNWIPEEPAEVAELREQLATATKALAGLEMACDALAASRGQQTYLSMIDSDKAGDLLLNLDAARYTARAALGGQP